MISLTEEWNDYENSVLPTCSSDSDEIKVAFLAGASAILASLYEALQADPEHATQVFLGYSREIRSMLDPGPRRVKR